jgi:hypothetical protein
MAASKPTFLFYQGNLKLDLLWFVNLYKQDDVNIDQNFIWKSCYLYQKGLFNIYINLSYQTGIQFKNCDKKFL